MVQRELEKPGCWDNEFRGSGRETSICRFHTNPEGKDRAASCRPSSSSGSTSTPSSRAGGRGATPASGSRCGRR